MGALAVPRFTVEEYLAADDVAEVHFEYIDGEMFRLEMASVAHGLIGGNLIHGLVEKLKGGPCRVMMPTRLRVAPSKYMYPDILVHCGDPTPPVRDTIADPKVIIEILSRSTENYDRGGKFDYYREIASVQDYVLVSQDRRRIDVHSRTPENDWIQKRFEGVEASVTIPSLGISIPLAQIYSHVDVPL